MSTLHQWWLPLVRSFGFIPPGMYDYRHCWVHCDADGPVSKTICASFQFSMMPHPCLHNKRHAEKKREVKSETSPVLILDIRPFQVIVQFAWASYVWAKEVFSEVMELETCGGLFISATEPVLVLGAAGGAGSMAVALLASQGYKAGVGASNCLWSVAFAGPSGGCIFQTCRLCATLGWIMSEFEFAQHHCRSWLIYST